METYALDPNAIDSVKVHVYQAAYDVLSAVDKPTTVHQSKFSMGFVLALIARDRRAGVSEFSEAALKDPDLLALHDKVSMIVDPEIEAVYPQQWCARVEVTMNTGERFSQFVDTPLGDPGNSLSREQLAQKAHRLAQHFNVCAAPQMEALIERIWDLPSIDLVAGVFRID